MQCSLKILYYYIENALQNMELNFPNSGHSILEWIPEAIHYHYNYNVNRELNFPSSGNSIPTPSSGAGDYHKSRN